MRPADTQPDAAVRSIPLDRLTLSDANVRKTDPGLHAFAQLKASIAAIGVLSNLVVRAVDDAPGHFAVVAGGRRYKALVDLAGEGQVPPDMPVPCRIVPTDASAAEISLAENVVRTAMHPADQVEAFAALAGAGATVAAIAARFGVAERTVEQRLRLGNAAPELLAAYREDAIDLECLKAFSVTADRARQLSVWNQLSEQGYRPTGWQIKRMLTETRVPGNAAVARFVGADTYEAAGGALDRDLFADDDDANVWFEDPQLLAKLAQQGLQEIAQDLAKDWKWAEARVEVDWNATARFGRAHPIPADPTPEETAERDRLLTRQDELGNLADEDWTDRLDAEAEDIERRLDKIQEDVYARAEYAAADRARSGCIVTLDRDGSVHVIGGLVRPEDLPETTQTAGTATARPGTGDAAQAGDVAPPHLTAPERPSDPAAQARRDAGVGIGLADDLRAIRTAVVKAHLARDFQAAFDLFVFQAVRGIFTAGYNPDALDIAVRETPDRPPVRRNDDSFREHSPAEAVLADRSALNTEWLAIDDDREAFSVFRALPAAEKETLFSACVARTVKGQLAFEHDAKPELEATVARLDIDFAAEVRPSDDMFWSRIKKSQILDIARATLGNEWATSHSRDRKAVLAQAMHRAFRDSDDVPAGVTPEARAAALAWTIPGFAAFDTGSPHDPDPEPAAPQPPDDHADPAPADSDSIDPMPEPADPANSDDDTSDARFTVDPDSADRSEQTERPVSDAIDAMNAVPTADGGPRVIVHRPGPVNGHAAGDEALDIPEFLRRS